MKQSSIFSLLATLGMAAVTIGAPVEDGTTESLERRQEDGVAAYGVSVIYFNNDQCDNPDPEMVGVFGAGQTITIDTSRPHSWIPNGGYPGKPHWSKNGDGSDYINPPFGTCLTGDDQSRYYMFVPCVESGTATEVNCYA